MPEQIKEFLQSFRKIDKVLGVMLLNHDGEILAKIITSDNQPDILEQEVFACFQLGEKLGDLLKLGNLNQSYLEYPNSNFTSETIRNKNNQAMLLIIISQEGVNLGRIRMEIRRVKKMLEEVPA